MLAAEYTRGGRGRPATLGLTNIIGGRRTRWLTFNVASKREARQIAAGYGAKPWNF